MCTSRLVTVALALATCGLLACDGAGGPWIGGIGAGLRHRARDSTLVVDDVPPRGNAAAAGLRSGDRVVEIDGTPVSELDAAAIVSRLRGPVGSTVTLTILRAGRNQTLVLERAPYE
jgi:C-terminal processing protease CtpA/Prc